MGKFEGTPGPWHLDPEGYCDPGYVAVNGQGWNSLAQVVVEMEKGGGERKPCKQGLANARAIAALPDLLEACEIVRRHYERLTTPGTDGAGGRYWANGEKHPADRFAGLELSKEEVLAIVAAITKATGQDQTEEKP